MQHISTTALIDSDALVTSEVSAVVNLGFAEAGALQVTHGANPAAAVFASASDIDATANTFTKVAHGFITGTVGQFTTSSALPTGISALTNYYAVKVDADTLKFSDTYAHAIAGTNLIDISNTGTGNQTYTPTALSVSVQPQVSNVDSPSTSSTSADWTAKGSALSLSGAAASTAVEYEAKELAHKWFRLVTTHTAGQASIDAILNLKG
jgi:hypothetical protein